MDHDKTTSFDLRSMFDQEPAHDGSKRQACLIAISGLEPGRVYWLAGEKIMIGRDDNATVCLKDDGVSRQHAVLHQREDRQFVVTDLDSSNGTFCNNQPITTNFSRRGTDFTWACQP